MLMEMLPAGIQLNEVERVFFKVIGWLIISNLGKLDYYITVNGPLF